MRKRDHFILAIAGILGLSTSGFAATIQIDSVDEDTGCSLVEAMISANANATRTRCASTTSGSFGSDIVDIIEFNDPATGPWEGGLHGKYYPGTGTGTGGSGLPPVYSAMVFNGNGKEIYQWSQEFRALFIMESGDLTINNLIIDEFIATDNTGGFLNKQDFGGAIYNEGKLVINQSEISENAAERGAGIYNSSTGDLKLIDSQITGNNGPGLENWGTLVVYRSSVSNNDSTGRAGGGLFNMAGATATITQSLISGNTTPSVGGGLINVGTLYIKDSTISGNTASSDGGGIVTSTTASTTVLKNVTLSNNTGRNGGGIFLDGGSLQMANTLISGNQLIPVGGSATEIRINSGDVDENQNNLIGHGGITTTQAVYALPAGSASALIWATSDGQTPTPLTNIIGPLATNGGPTKTHALAGNSPAIDKGFKGGFPLFFSEGCYVPPLPGFSGYYRDDQRGISRPQKQACDIGAYEYEETTFFMVPAANGKTVIFGL